MGAFFCGFLEIGKKNNVLAILSPLKPIFLIKLDSKFDSLFW